MEKLPYYKAVVKSLCSLYNAARGVNYDVELLTSKEFERIYKKPSNVENCGGFYEPSNGKIVIFYDHIADKREKFRNDNSGDNGLTYLIRAVFHELEHKLQHEDRGELTDFSDIDFFKLDVEMILLVMVNYDQRAKAFYRRFHDNMFVEIDADIKGVNNALYASKRLGIKDLNWRYYESYRIYNEFRKQIYDLPYFVGVMNEYIRKKPELFLSREFGYFKNKAIYEFYRDDGSYKSLFEIMYNSKINGCDPRVRAYMVTDFYFLERLDFDNLSSAELNYVLENIRIVYDDHLRRKAYYERYSKSAQSAIDYASRYGNKDAVTKANIETLSNPGYYKYLNKILNRYSLGGDSPRIRPRS